MHLGGVGDLARCWAGTDGILYIAGNLEYKDRQYNLPICVIGRVAVWSSQCGRCQVRCRCERGAGVSRSGERDLVEQAMMGARQAGGSVR